MARFACCIAFVATGCSFSGATPSGEEPPTVDASLSSDGTIADAPLPDAIIAKTCGVDDPVAGLIACFEFENNLDETIGDVPAAQAVGGIAYRMGANDSGEAALFDGNNYIRAGASAGDYQSDSVTLEMWVRPVVIPQNERDGIADLQSQLGIFIAPGGGVLCNGGWGSVVSNVTLPANQWTHVACRQSQNGGMEVFVGGDQIACNNNGNAPGTPNDDLIIAGNSPDGSQRMTGAIDTLRYWNRALTDAELCSAAGRLTCAPAAADCSD